MDGLTQTLYDIVQYILGFGATVMLPLVIFVLALVFRIKPAKAFRSALVVGIGFVGVFAIFSLMGEQIGPAAQAIVERTGLSLPAVDLGWAPLSAITWGSPIAPFAIVLTLLINLVMLAVKWTKTIDIDIWNYWHFAFAGCLVYVATGNFALGLLGSAIAAVIIIKIADWCAPLVQKYCNLPGISLPTLSSAVFFPIGLLGNWILDKVPGINKLHADPETIQKRFGIFGEPMMVGFMLGMLLGLLAGYDFKGVLALAINLGAVMYILPRMVRILMDGLIPISDGVKDFMARRFPDRADFYIGLDIAVAIGNPAIISTGLLLTPIAILLAFLVPGNQTLPVADLSNMAVFCSMIVVACNQNIVRAVIIAIPCLIGDLLVCSAAAPLITQLATSVGYDTSASGSLVTAFLDGGNPFRYLIYQVFSGNIVAAVVAVIVAVLVAFTWRVTHRQAYMEG
ncbi:PTS system Galactitol-specific IIC component [Olsenella uli DSM 7084]|uniref:PTS system Galactitol-specific IIC component n=1 Tax=Olsenella uli (strain ATCC 49627 / DSM 7084 / CCUG 31166 / CIP 109912 / JCM 12494 / LMG 11480 / NCIMB 702895 / VPI D76D-27C) TaxID=633147 RepID=E1QYR6_OLSUV|nr:PTS galactitol transporter subunit IIC [Olsenella uli]ADK67530.1 PTS system Galactitol-specific IIC component [Olsenella uli DSM 7084]KRO13686.1 PTS system Galactitol-specific IIC component [Olsenella uli DSM 7084]